MSAPCNRKNPLMRGGTNQAARSRRELDPSFVRVDERTQADLIEFARRFSRHVRYYDSLNRYDGSNPAESDWYPFFSRDPSAILAAISKLPVASLFDLRRSIRSYLTASAPAPDEDLANHFKLLFHLPLMLTMTASLMMTKSISTARTPILQTRMPTASMTATSSPIGEIQGT